MIRAVTSIRYFVITLLMLATAAGPAVALAQSQARDERSWHLAVALGDGRRTNPLVDGKATDIHYVVDLAWYGDKFFFDNGDVGYTFTTMHNLSFSTLLTFSNERNDYSFLTGRQFGLGSQFSTLTGSTSGSASTAVPPLAVDPTKADTIAQAGATAGFVTASTASSTQTMQVSLSQANQTPLAHRDTALNGGFELLYISPLGDIQAQVLSDVGNTHDGQSAWLSWSHPWYTANSQMALTFGAEWKSRKLVGYYYGVRPDEVLAARPRYDGASGTNTYIRLTGRYQLTEHISLAAMAEREFLSSAITASPVVTSDTVSTFFTGIFYNF